MTPNNKTFKNELRLSGSGGQGLITAGIILAKAAVIDRLNVTQTQSYGPESRGGASRADVIISNTDFYYPEATNFDILLTLTQEACDKYVVNLKSNGILIADNTQVKSIPLVEAKVYEYPFTDIAIKKLGTALPTNIMSLGFLVKITNIVSEKSLKEAVKNSVKSQYVDLNMKALRLGFKLAEDNMKNKEKK
ncbi:MAG: 2-oxoglutarate ferredoxin oxidoreductase subunit gamma [Candidatus Cloacimonadota bacterium]|jgi:2-oxoglutarate ferredoxin oxidoreductase subunit gamma|nr:2-oxoglutarate ferredoxin oxidoreductase subunit gamma [Candidatus Cloacimonadota bacterium]